MPPCSNAGKDEPPSPKYRQKKPDIEKGAAMVPSAGKAKGKIGKSHRNMAAWKRFLAASYVGLPKRMVGMLASKFYDFFGPWSAPMLFEDRVDNDPCTKDKGQ